MKQFYFIILFLLHTTIISAKGNFDIDPPVVTADDSSICIGSDVTLTAVGTGTITWHTAANGSSPSLGTGPTLTVSPTVTITYYAKVTSTTTPIETAMSTGTLITVNQIPTVTFSFDNNNACSGTAVHFTSTPANGSGPYTYAWDFGDGETSTAANPTHNFTALGCATQTFTVSLTVTSNGCSSSTTSQTITVKQKPNINFYDVDDLFAPEPFNNCNDASLSNPSFTINVGNSSSSTCITSYTIDWGDNSADVPNAVFPQQHTYSQLGVYTLTITAYGTNGCNSVKTYTIKNVSNPAGGLSSPGSTTNLCAPTQPLNFEITNWQTNSPGTIYTIDYGDGTPPVVLSHPLNNTNSNQPVPHIYTTTNCPAPEFIAVLTISNACGETMSTINAIKIIKQPEPSFTNPQNACVNTNVTFTNTSAAGYNTGCTTGAQYVWNFGDGSTQTVGPVNSPENITHQYSVAGTYTVTLAAQNGCGLSNVFSNTICIESPLPSASFTLNTATGCGSLTAQATNTTPTANACDVDYNWSVAYAATNCGIPPGAGHNYFNGSTTATSVNPSFNFPNPGTYTVTLTAHNSCGNQTASQVVVVKAPPTAAINNIPNICGGSSGIINPTAVVTNCGTNAITYQWNFPGGSPVSFTGQTPPAITYTTAGDYTVTLAVTNECGTTTVTEDFTVSPVPVMSALSSQEKCAGELSNAVAFASDLAGTTYTWTNSNTGIGLAASGSGASIPAFATTNATNASITATVTVTPTSGSCNGAVQTFTITVNPNPVVAPLPGLTLCHDESQTSIIFASAVSGTTFAWTNNNTAIGLAANGVASLPAFTAVNTGTSPITATITATPTANGCTGSPMPFTITVNPTPAPLTLTDLALCNGVQSTGVAFTNPVAGTTYTWTNSNPSIGLPANGTGDIPAFVPVNTGSAPATATITVTPALGTCEGPVATFAITVSPSPLVAFSEPNQIICSGEETAAVALTSPTADVTLAWTAIEPAGIEGVTPSGSDSIPVQMLLNTTDAPITVTYNATASLSGGSACEGSSFAYTITVNPRPEISDFEEDVCSNVPFAFTPQTGGGNSIPAGTTYSWNAPAVVAGITGLASGTGQSSVNGTLINTNTAAVIINYVVTPEANGCSGNIFEAAITVAPTPAITAIDNETVCNGAATETITFSGAVTGTVFNWVNDNPSIGLAAAGSGDIPAFTTVNGGTSAVTATITVTPELNGCTGPQQTFAITVNPAPNVQASVTDQIICSGTASTAVSLTSATPGAAISWTAAVPDGVLGVITSGTNSIPAQILTNTTQDPVVITYTAVAATGDTSGCPGAPFNYTITVTPVPFADGEQQAVTCSGTAPDFIPENTGNTNMPNGVAFTWTAPTGSGFTGGSAQTTPQPSLNQVLVNTTNNPVTATYTVTPSFGGCNGVPFTVVLTINPAAVISGADMTLCSGSDFEFDPSLNASTLPAGTVYQWDAPAVTAGMTGGQPGTGQTLVTGTLTNASASVQTATYTITPISPEGNCAGVPFTLTVTVNPAFTVASALSDYNGFEISSAGASDGSIDLVPTGGSGTYTYSWEGPGTFTAASQDVSGLIAGTYTVTIDDGLCEPIELTFELQQPLPMTIVEVVASHIDVECFGQATGVIEIAITQISIAPFDYQLSLADGTIVETVTNSAAESYVFDGLAAGAYNVLVTDANGGSQSLTNIVITQPDSALAITNAVVSDYNGFGISCNGAGDGSIDINVSGGTTPYSYSWTGPGGFESTSQDISGLAPGTYEITVTDASEICPAIATYIITEPDVLDLTAVVSDYNGFAISCFGGNDGSITVTPLGGSGSYLYVWEGPGTFSAATQSIDNLTEGTYTLQMSDTNGCQVALQTYTLTQPPVLNASETHVNVVCFGDETGSIDVTASGGYPVELSPGVFGYNYAWQGPDGFTSASEDLTAIAAGTYTVIITDSAGCPKVLTTTISQQPEIIIIPTTTEISCYGANDASISVAISGGDPPYDVTWNTLATGTFQDNLGAGTYIITVTDDSGCQQDITVIIDEAPLFDTDPVFTHISCFGAQDGSIALNLAGGIAPVTLVWSDGSTAGTTRNNLGPGTYTATITDATPCTIQHTFTIVQPAALTLGAAITHAHDCDDAQSGAINLIVAGGTPPYAFDWSNGETVEDLAGITSGTYSVIITDANGCSATGTYNITRPEPVVLNVTSNLSVDCDNHSVVQTNIAQASGGVPPYQYTWSAGNVSGAFGQFMNTNQNGTIIVTATDSQGCEATATFDVETQWLGTAEFTAGSYSFTTFREYSIFDPVTFENLSTGDYTEVGWDFGDGSTSNELNPSHTYVREGTYIVTLHVVYPYGCTDTYTMALVVSKGYEVMVPNAFTPNSDGVNDTFNAVHKGLKAIELNVYSTWGELVYSERGETLTGWNGYVKNNPSENGNFYFRIKAETFYGHIVELDGPFVLIK